MTITEKLVVAGLAASLMACITVSCIGTLQAVIRKEHPVVRKYETVYVQVGRMAEHLGE